MLEDRVPEELVLTPTPVEDEADEEIILTLSPTEEEAEKDELILETEIPDGPEEITFDGESEAEAKVKAAMEAYDAAMDNAAGIKNEKI